MMVNIKLSSLNLTTKANLGEKYEVAIQEIAFESWLSSPDKNLLHRQKLGRCLFLDDGIEAEVYAFDLSSRSIHLDKTESKGHGHLRVVSIGRLQCGILVSQWPSPWLAPSRFLSGDPNAALLVVRISVSTVEATERLEVLQRLFAGAMATHSSTHISPLLPSVLSPVPRVAFTVDIGNFCSRLIYVDSSGTNPFAMEARTDGFALSAHSSFLTSAVRKNNNDDEISDGLPHRMILDIYLVLKPTFFRVRSDYQSGGGRFSKLDTLELDTMGDPVFCLEAIEVNGQGSALGEIDDAQSIVSIDSSSIFLDLHCMTEAISVEVWHPNVITAISKVLSVMGNHSPSSSTIPVVSSSRLLDRLPTGLSCTMAVTRFVLFVTGPDLNPDEDKDITRGIAFRTGISVHYAGVHSTHVQSLQYLPTRAQSRHKLYLPEERMVEAVAAAKSSTVTQQTHFFARVALWDTAVRSAAATHFVPDDPYIAERDDPALKSREFIHIRNVKADINISSKRGRTVTGSVKDTCQLNLHIPYVGGTFQLVHVYSLLLAAQTVKSMMQHRTQGHRPPAKSTMVFLFKGTIKTLQVSWNLSSQRFITRIDSMNAHYSLNDKVGLGVSTVFFWVPIPPRLHKWDENTKEKWEELGRLQSWCTSLSPSSEWNILMEGDSARLRIPSGFVLAQLILDVSVTIKCLRHLSHMIAAGSYSDMPAPQAEATKKMPNLTVRVGCLLLEAADDSLETRLGLIWRAGSDACRQRLDREDAFRAKVAVILAAETRTSPLDRESESDYQFSAAHTVSVEDARVRLSVVHAVDWVLRHEEAMKRSCKQEHELKQRLLGQHAMKGAVDVPNLVTVTAVDDVPPLFRAIFRGLYLKLSRPSFTDDRLPDFLYEQGRGIPRDTLFSLLLPMHVNSSLNSLRVCLRDYPIPLLDIPEHSKKNSPVWELNTDLVIAEEMGTPKSIDWIKCPIVGTQSDIHGAKPMWINVPKTIMPVKSYANPTVHVEAQDVTSFAWGGSYGAATQDITRVLETLSTPPRDSSPHLGFWDKVSFL
jgi:hypothetical protein